MDNLIFSLNATLPVFLVIVLGYLLNKKGMFTESFISVANKFTFKVCLPVMIFVDMASTDLRASFDWKIVLYAALSTVIMFSIIWIGAKLLIKDKSIVGAFVQASYRSSVAVMGFAFMLNIYGKIGLMPMIVIGCVPLYNICAVIVLTFESRDAINNPDKGDKIKKAFLDIIKNPIIIGIVLGCIGSVIRITEYMPQIISKTLSSVSVIATPLSLIVIGASFKGAEAIKKLKPTIISSLIKLVVLPIVFITAAVLLGFRGEALLALAIMFGSPTTPSCFIMAKSMNNDEVLTSSVIAATTLLSALTLTAVIFIIKALGLI